MRLFAWTRLAVAFVVACWLAVTAARAGNAVLLDDALLTALVRTKVPNVRIAYLDDEDKIEFRSEQAYGLVDALLTARFERVGRRIQLKALSLRVGFLAQRSRRFEEAAAALRKLVDVETPLTRVEIYRTGKLVYSQDVP